MQREMTRRRWMIATAGCMLSAASARADSSEKALTRIQEQAKKAGLQDIRSSEFEFYLGVGNAPDAFRTDAMHICHDLAGVYLKHFQGKGFPVEAPKSKLILVTLKDRSSYEAFSENAPGGEVGGHYDLDTNALVVFDFRPDQKKRAASSQRINTFTLVHESLHQLSFNTGLLELAADVPTCISEGLATYGELWQSSAKRAAFGRVNTPRLSVLKELLPIEKLLTHDELFEADEDSADAAYSQSWLLMHYLMSATNVPKFRAYLSAIRKRRDPKGRIEDARAHLGDLARLDASLRRYAIKLR